MTTPNERPAPSPCPLIFAREAEYVTGCCRRTLLAWGGLGVFPKTVRVGRRWGWSRKEVLTWLEARVGAR